MNNSRTEQLLIEGYKADFEKQTGRCIKISFCTKLESLVNFTGNINPNTLIKMILDATGWKFDQVFLNSFEKRSKSVKGHRKAEKVLKRGLFDFIASHNGASPTGWGRATGGRDHTTILHSIKNFEIRLEQEGYTRQLLKEVLDYIRLNYHDYKDRIYTYEDLMSEVVSN